MAATPDGGKSNTGEWDVRHPRWCCRRWFRRPRGTQSVGVPAAAFAHQRPLTVIAEGLTQHGTRAHRQCPPRQVRCGRSAVHVLLKGRAPLHRRLPPPPMPLAPLKQASRSTESGGKEGSGSTGGVGRGACCRDSHTHTHHAAPQLVSAAPPGCWGFRKVSASTPPDGATVLKTFASSLAC